VDERFGVIKILALEFSHYSTDFMGARSDYGQRAYFALAMIRAAYHGETWRPYASAGIGLGYLSSDDAMLANHRDTMLALSGSIGIPYNIIDTLAIGPFLQYKPCIGSSIGAVQFWDLGVAATFGL
jgi:hypothetical protein